MGTIKVYLADAPADVLVRLVDAGPQTEADLSAHFAAIHGRPVAETVGNALHMLCTARYIERDGTARWCATADGRHAVANGRRHGDQPCGPRGGT